MLRTSLIVLAIFSTANCVTVDNDTGDGDGNGNGTSSGGIFGGPGDGSGSPANCLAACEHLIYDCNIAPPSELDPCVSGCIQDGPTDAVLTCVVNSPCSDAALAACFPVAPRAHEDTCITNGCPGDLDCVEYEEQGPTCIEYVAAQ